MGLFTNLRKGSLGSTSPTSAQSQSIAEFETQLAFPEKPDELSEEDLKIKHRELESFTKMTDKEKLRWIKYKEGLGQWSTKDGAAGAYASGKCC